MNTTYIQFDKPKYKTSTDGFIKRTLKKLIAGILKTFIPKANPDYEHEIDNVTIWLVEFDNESRVPQREIGMNADGETILKMPYKNNYGYWTDNTLLLDDFKRFFSVKIIEKSDFELRWNQFIS